MILQNIFTEVEQKYPFLVTINIYKEVKTYILDRFDEEVLIGYWTKEDVEDALLESEYWERLGYEVGDDQYKELVADLKNYIEWRFDASIGLSWEVIEQALEVYMRDYLEIEKGGEEDE